MGGAGADCGGDHGWDHWSEDDARKRRKRGLETLVCACREVADDGKSAPGGCTYADKNQGRMKEVSRRWSAERIAEDEGVRMSVQDSDVGKSESLCGRRRKEASRSEDVTTR